MKLDLLIITRGRREDLVRALRSAVPQLRRADRCIVLENGCSERSTIGVQRYFPEVEFIRSEVNLGVGGGRNAVAAAATGDVLVFLDDDAVATPGLLEGIRATFTARPPLGLVALRIDDPATGYPRPHEFPHRRKTLADVAFAPAYFVGAGFAIRRQLFEEMGGFDPELRYSLEELDLSLRLLASDVELAYDPRLRVLHHASAGARPGGGYVEQVVRNRWRVPVRRLPAPMAASHVVLWTGYWFVRALREGVAPAWWRGVRAGVRGLPAALRSREPVPASTLRRRHARRWW